MTQTFLLLCVNISWRSHLLFVTWPTMWARDVGIVAFHLNHWNGSVFCSEKMSAEGISFKLFLLFRISSYNKKLYRKVGKLFSKSTHAETRRKVNLTKILILSKKLVRKCVVLLHENFQLNLLYGKQVVKGMKKF